LPSPEITYQLEFYTYLVYTQLIFFQEIVNWIIQGGFVFSLYLLHRKARHFIEDKDLGDYFIKAFPTTLPEAEGIRIFNPGDTVKDCFSLRFLEHFCEYFGFVDTRREKKTPYGFHLFIKKSALYDQYINWSNFT